MESDKTNPVNWASYKTVQIIAMTRYKSNFDVIEFADFRLFFELGTTKDNRGIGRVSRNILKSLKKYQTINTKQEKPNLYFFSSIHWCPEILPDHSIVMIHDTTPLSIPHFFHHAQDEWLYDFADIASQSKHIITISETSKSDIMKYFMIEESKISIIYNGITQFTPSDKPLNISPPAIPYVTFLGANDHHKNIDVVLNALALNDKKDIGLAVIGNAFDDIYDRARIWELDVNLIFSFGRLSDAATRHILEKSIALVMPSLYEGFGLPPLEAGLLCVPSICSNRPALNEIMANASLLVDPFLPRDWLAAIRRLQTDHNLAKELSAAAQLKGQYFTWERNIAALIEVFKNIAKDINYA